MQQRPTRFLIIHTTPRLIKGIILIGSHQGTKYIIHRITLYSSNNPYTFKWERRRQFPLQHDFEEPDYYLLSKSCFTHEQLYVTFSRCGYPPNDIHNTGLKIVVYDTPIQGQRKSMGGVRTNDMKGITTQNIILKEIFRNVKN